MEKIGILSMQRVMNHGSFLQAYALKKTVEANIPDVECEFIDLPSQDKVKSVCNPKSHIDTVKFWYHKLRKHKMICDEYNLRWNYYRFGCVYRECLRSYLGVTDYPNHNTNYKAVIIGSDEVFNCTQEDAAWGSSMMLFGDGITSPKIISYAASFGYTTEERIRQSGLYEKVAANLQNFCAVSVRDSNSEQIVSKMLKKTPKKHLDPVFIYDFQKELKKIKKKRKLLVVYQYQNRISEQSTIDEIKRIAKKEKCKIVSAFEYCSWADENLVLTPFEAMEYIKEADYVVTDTFHGCVMSIKFNKKFAAFCRETNHNKMMDLLRTFQLEQQLVTEENSVLDILNHEIDWNKINHIIYRQKENTVAYLMENLTEKKDEISI